MADVSRAQLVVFREVSEKAISPLLIGTAFTKTQIDTTPKRSVVAHLGSRFGPVIAATSKQEFHVHPSVSSNVTKMLQQYMLTNREPSIVLEEMPSPKELSFRRNVTLSLTIKYHPSLAQREKEREPQLYIYLSDNVFRGVHIATNLSEDQPTELKLQLKTKMIRPTVPYDCLVNVQAYAQYKNESDQWCLNQCGYTNVLLPFALKSGQVYDQRLFVNNSEHPDRDDKGTVQIQIHSLTFDDDGKDVPVDFKDSSLEAVRSSMKRAQNCARAYINKNRDECYSRIPASSPSVEFVTVFSYQNQSHGYTPGCYFDVFRIPRSNLEFSINVLQEGRSRSHLIDRDPETNDRIPLLKFFRQASRRARLKVVMWALVVYVTSCPYITDEVDHNHRGRGARWIKKLLELMESFDNMIIRDAGDCEDFTRAVLVLVHAIKRDYGVRAANGCSGGSDGDELMLQMTDLLNGFVFCSGLCGVSSMALDDLKKKQSSGKSVELNGHEGAFAIDRATFLKAILRHDPECDVAVCMQKEAKAYPRYYQESDRIYPLECTGVLNPEPSNKTKEEKDLETALQKLASKSEMRVMEDARTVFTYDPHGSNNFYKMFITLMTPEFMVLRGVPVVEFVLYERNEHRPSYRGGRHIGKRGVWFDELLDISNNEHICLTGCPPFTPELEDACATITKDNAPIWKPFSMIEKAPVEWKQYETALGGPVVPKENEGNQTRSNFFLPAHLMTPRHVQELQALAASVRCKLNARLELIRQNPNGHQVGNFVISFTSDE